MSQLGVYRPLSDRCISGHISEGQWVGMSISPEVQMYLEEVSTHPWGPMSRGMSTHSPDIPTPWTYPPLGYLPRHTTPPWTYLPLEGTWYQRYRPVDRHTPVKTWPSSNFVGMRQLSETFKWAFKWIILNGSCDKFVLSQIIFCN